MHMKTKYLVLPTLALALAGCVQTNKVDYSKALQQISAGVQQLNKSVGELNSRVEKLENSRASNNTQSALDPTVKPGWVLYTNTEFDFSIQHPDSWSVTKQEVHPLLLLFQVRDKNSAAHVTLTPTGKWDHGLPFETPTITTITIDGATAEQRFWPSGTYFISNISGAPTTWSSDGRIEAFSDRQDALIKEILSTIRWIPSGDCSLLNNSAFQSVNQYEVGISPNGLVMGYWSIGLENGKIEWLHSDISESGSYNCSNNLLQVKFSNQSGTASYEKDRDILIWNNIEYRRVTQPGN